MHEYSKALASSQSNLRHAVYKSPCSYSVITCNMHPSAHNKLSMSKGRTIVTDYFFGWQVLSEQIISNESRIAKTKVIVNFNKPRQMQFTFLVRYEDFNKVEAICSDMKDHLLNTEGIHRQLPMWVGFTGVEGNACNVYTIVRVLLLTTRYCVVTALAHLYTCTCNATACKQPGPVVTRLQASHTGYPER